MLRFACFFLVLGCGAASSVPQGSSGPAAPVNVATAPEAPDEMHLGAIAWHLEDRRCQSIILPHEALPRDPTPCLNVDLHPGVSAALLRQVDLIGAQVPVLLSIEPGVVFPDVTMHHVQALRFGGGHFDTAPLPSRALFPAVRYLATHRSVVMPDSGWLEADEVQLGLTLIDEDSLSVIQAVAERVIALQIFTPVAGRREELARLTNLRDVLLFERSPETLDALPATVTYLDLQGASDALLARLPRLVNLRWLSLDGARLESLVPLSNLDLRSLSLQHARLGDNAIAEFPTFPNLERLNLYEAQNVDRRIAPALAAMTSLKVLNLEATGIDNTAALSGLTSLIELTLARTAITDEDVAMLSDLSSLRSLSLRATQITEAGLRTLPPVMHLDLAHNGGLANLCGHEARLGAVRSLDLSFTRMADAAASCIAQLSNLETLSLANTYITDASMADLSRLGELRELILMSAMLSDAGLAELHRLGNLRILSIEGTQVTDASVELLLEMQLQYAGLEATQLSENGRERVMQSLSSQVQTELRSGR